MTVHLLTGDDESILRAAVSELVHELVGDGDRSLMVDEFDGDDVEVRGVVDAAQTPPFLTDRRVVVVRDVGRFTADELAPLVAYLADPLPTTELVLVGGGGRLAEGADRRGQGGRRAWCATPTPPSRAAIARPGSSPRPRPAASSSRRRPPRAIADRLGEDVGRLDGILQTLAATYGGARQLGPDEVEPFLGEGGGVPPWELTDAIDAGEHGDRAGAAGPDDRARRSPPAAADGDPARPLRAAGPPRRRRRDLGGAGRRRCSASSRGSRRRRRSPVPAARRRWGAAGDRPAGGRRPRSAGRQGPARRRRDGRPRGQAVAPQAL